MIIDCSYLKRFKKIIDRLKDPNQPIFDSILLDFKNQVATFGSQKGFGKIKMPVTGANGTEKPFFVNAVAFLAVVEVFPTLELDGYAFKSGSDNLFEVAHFEDESFDYPDFIQSSDDLSFKITKPILSVIKRAGSFTEEDSSASLNGVFFLNGHVYGTNKSRMYEEYVEDCKDVTLGFPRSVWETLVLDVMEGSLTVKKNESQFFVSAGDEISIQFAMSNELSGPDVTTDKFKASYNHADKVYLDRNTLEELSAFFVPFVANVNGNRVKMIFSDKDIEILTEDGNRISRKMPLKQPLTGSLVGAHIWVSNAWLKAIVGSLPPGDTVVIQIDINRPTTNFFIEGKPDTHVIYSRLREES